MSTKSTREIKKWFEKSFSLDSKNLEDVVTTLLKVLKSQGFKIRKKKDSDQIISIEAYYGSKIIAVLVGLIPFIGKNVPWGKRLFLKTQLSSETDRIYMKINISPHMELFDTSEVLVLSQSVDEKATDEYLAAVKVNAIVKDLYAQLGLVLPEDFAKFEFKKFAIDYAIGLLLYPLDGYKSVKKIHFSSERGPIWSWGAFIVPEFWFMWHEIWGVSILSIFLDFLLIRIIFKNFNQSTLVFVLILFLIIRVVFGRLGSRIYFARYGRWAK
jgi:hypothetical protein